MHVSALTINYKSLEISQEMASIVTSFLDEHQFDEEWNSQDLDTGDSDISM